MFGDIESESPRVPSPWDSFLPSPPSSIPSSQNSLALENGIPKLVPEVEEGNIEYKLKLTNISNARFARLVTQLKWRLLEGGGQAYYELGVADSGALIGLSRADLEESLETLEMMAGEIGASVIVVKEIEVPPTITALADKESGYTDPETGEWTRKMRRRPPLALGGLSSDGGVYSASTHSTTEAETDFSAAELTDTDDIASSVSSASRTPGIATPSSTSSSTYTSVTATSIAHRPVRTHPSRPTAQSSPFIAPIDDDLALFSMEPEPAFPDDEPDGDTSASGVTADDELDVSLGLGLQRLTFAGLEISAVFKPRPVRRRTRPGAAPLGPTPGRHGKRLNRNKEKKVHPWRQQSAQGAGSAPVEMSKEEKAEQRRLARDKKREEKRNALAALAQNEGQDCTASWPSPAVAAPSGAYVVDVTSGDGEIDEEQLTKASAVMTEVGDAASALVDGIDELHAAVDESTSESPVVETRQLVEEMSKMRERLGETEREARLIVEALVVRKMSIEEATLDFSRLALI